MDKKRLISLDEALEATHKEVFWTESEQAAVRSFLVKLPRVDAVEVVRCKDCIHWKKGDAKGGNSIEDLQWIGGCKWAKCCRREMDFCSYGERKTDV